VTVKSGRIAPVYKGEWERSRGFGKDREFNVRWLRAAQRVLKHDGTLSPCCEGKSSMQNTRGPGDTSLYSFQMQRIPELRFSATLGEEPEIELALG
jgi:hypothetical protein